MARIGHMQARCWRMTALAFGGALLRTTFAIEHISPGHFVLTRAHQGKLYMVLHIFDMEGTAARLTTRERLHHILGEVLYEFPNSCRCRSLASVDGQKSLGHGYGNLHRFKGNHRAIAADQFEII